MNGEAAVNLSAIDIRGLRNSPVGEGVVREFEKQCHELCKHMIEQRENPNENDERVMEIEGRIGQYDEGKREFVPGVNERFFHEMLKYLVKKQKDGWPRADVREKMVSLVETDHIDVVFQDRVRVSCAVKREGERVSSVEIKEVITKTKANRAQPVFKIESKTSKFDLRIGVAFEEAVPKDSESYKSHCACAEKLIMDAFNVKKRVKIMGGIELSIADTCKQVILLPELPGEAFARGHMPVKDPFYNSVRLEDNVSWLDARLARLLKWTMLQPNRLLGLAGNATVVFKPPSEDLPKPFYLTNLPGLMTLPDGKKFAAYACQYVIEVKHNHILCGHGRFAKDEEEREGNHHGQDYAVKNFRKKHRWSFTLRHSQRLDMTETRTSSNLVDLFHGKDKPTYEVEVERTLTAIGSRDIAPNALAAELKAVAIADAFLSDIASRIYGFALPPLEKEQHLSDTWMRARKADDERRENFMSMMSRFSGSSSPKMLRQSSSMSVSTQEGSLKRKATEELRDDRGARPALSDQQAAATHYNELGKNRATTASRNESMIYHMRCLNNFVKSVAIKEALGRMRRDCKPSGPINILDLACGRGADIQKFLRACKELKIPVDRYVGIDIAKSALDDAIKRLKEMRDKPPNVNFVGADLGKAFLSPDPDDNGVLVDYFDGSGWSRIPGSETLQNDARFQLVSMQFALHYMFQSLPRCNHFLRTLSKHMDIGGVFIATTVYADEMVKRLMDAGPGKSDFSIKDEFGSNVCRVRFDPTFRERCFRSAATVPSTSGGASDMMGIRYEFSLQDDEGKQAVDAPEWLVPPKLLVKLATVNCFRLVRYERMPNCAIRHIDSDKSQSALYRRMNVLNYKGTISQVEWDIASLYVVVELQKEDRPADYVSALRRLKERIHDYDQLPDQERSELLTAILKP